MGSNPRGKINGQKTASTNYKTAPFLQSACKPFWAIIVGLRRIALERFTLSKEKEGKAASLNSYKEHEGS